MRTALTALFLAVALAAAGCSVDSAPESEPTRASSVDSESTPASSATTSPSAPVDVRVPDVTGARAGRATTVLTEVGLTVRRLDVMGTACRARGEVLAQRPGAGTVMLTGQRVRIEVNIGAMRDCGLDAERATTDLQRVATAFVRFARGKSPSPPVDTPVILLVGGVRTKVIPGEAQLMPRAWASCPAGGHYAGRTCQINPIRAIVDHSGPLAFLAQLPTHSCAHPRPVTPGEVGATYAVAITPDELLDCTSFWAVELLVNDVGQVVAVNTVWAEP
jgi:hypothetical protein